jgi:hypothetical protein
MSFMRVIRSSAERTTSALSNKKSGLAQDAGNGKNRLKRAEAG